jgi:hypothetical protein
MGEGEIHNWFNSSKFQPTSLCAQSYTQEMTATLLKQSHFLVKIDSEKSVKLLNSRRISVQNYQVCTLPKGKSPNILKYF